MSRDQLHTYVITCTEIHEVKHRIRARSKLDAVNRMANNDNLNPISRKKMLDRSMSIRQEIKSFDKTTTHYII
jgi:hypothetical protein